MGVSDYVFSCQFSEKRNEFHLVALTKREFHFARESICTKLKRVC